MEQINSINTYLVLHKKTHYDVKKNRPSWIYIKWRILDLKNEMSKIS